MNFLDDAALYTSLGWKIFPVAPEVKAPLTPNGFYDATDDADTIGEWANSYPNANIGIWCGASNLMVIDCDPRNGSEATLKKWDAEGKRFTPTSYAETRAGGWHLYYTLKKPLPAEWRKKLPGGIDVQVGGKYVLAPNSFVDGRKLPKPDQWVGHYKWIRKPAGPDLPEAPRWFMDLLKPPPAPRFHGRAASSTVESRLEGAAMKVANAAPGTRNDELNKQAHLVGRMIVEDGLNEEVGAARLYEAAISAGLAHREIQLTIRSGLKSGKEHAVSNPSPKQTKR